MTHSVRPTECTPAEADVAREVLDAGGTELVARALANLLHAAELP